MKTCKVKYCPGCGDFMVLEYMDNMFGYNMFYCERCTHFTMFYGDQAEFYAWSTYKEVKAC